MRPKLSIIFIVLAVVLCAGSAWATRFTISNINWSNISNWSADHSETAWNLNESWDFHERGWIQDGESVFGIKDPFRFRHIHVAKHETAWFPFWRPGYEGFTNINIASDWVVLSMGAGPVIGNDNLWCDNHTPAPVPEPATILLIGVGLIGFTGVGIKRKLKA